MAAPVKKTYTSGRPPWFDVHGELKDAFIIGIAGGSASGKTTVADLIIKELQVPYVCLVSQDAFYRVLNKEQMVLAHHNEFDFDHPDAMDLDLMADTLRKLKEGKSVEIPVYDFSTHSRRPETVTKYGANVIIFEGIFTFATEALRSLMDVKIFVDEDADIRLARRLHRDIKDRGRSLEGTLKQYNRFVKPNFERFIKPTMAFADLVMPRGASNTVAMELIVRHVKTQLEARGFNVRSQLALQAVSDVLPSSVHVVPPTNQIRAMHTILRNKHTAPDDFVFSAERLTRVLMESALSHMPFESVDARLPCGRLYAGKRASKQVCGVSIFRAGMTMDHALQATVKDACLGKILIQTNPASGEAELHFCKLPRGIENMFVVLMDATVATGAAAMMAVRVLLDHEVPQENILLTTLLGAPTGFHAVAYAFPRVRIVTTAVDQGLDERLRIVPGFGNFGDRFYGMVSTSAPAPANADEPRAS